MSDDIDYVYLVMPMKWVLSNEKLEFEADNNECPHFKRMKVYFNLLQNAVKQNNRDVFFKIFGKLVCNEKTSLRDMFLHSFLEAFDEEDFMEHIFETKDTMDDGMFLSFSNAAKEVRNFKKYMKENPPCCCSH